MEVTKDLEVEGYSTLHGRVYANDGISAKDGIDIKTGKLEIKTGGAHIYGHVIAEDNVLVKGDLEVLGAKIYSGDVVVDGKLTVNNGLRVNTMHTSPALYVDGKSSFRNDMDVSKKITAGALDLDGDAGKYPQPLFVDGDGKFNGIVTAQNFNYHAPTEAPVTPAPGPVTNIDIDIDIDNLMLEISKRTLFVKNLYIGGDFGDEDDDRRAVSKKSLSDTSIRVQGLTASDWITSLNLEVTQKTMLPEETMVGQEKVLTAESLPEAAGTTESNPSTCSCPVADMTEFNAAAGKVVDDYLRDYRGTIQADGFREVVSRVDGIVTRPLTGDGGGNGLTEGDVERVVMGMTGLPCSCEENETFEDSGTTCDCPAPRTDEQIERMVETVVYGMTDLPCSCPVIDKTYVENLNIEVEGSCNNCASPRTDEEIERVVNGMTDLPCSCPSCDCPTIEVKECGCSEGDLSNFCALC